ncbi:MAG: hypothetical protein LAN62_03675 [Acidobacteriia bacterium]|nr:hypothetical protein [Terriglobia bacterium]
MRIFLEFSPGQTSVHRSRIGYAFRLFCAIYGHQPVEQPERADVWITYAPGRPGRISQPGLRLSNLYQPRSPYKAAPPPRGYAQNGDDTVVFYPPVDGQEPDWLAEIFEWVSCADEYSVETRDSVGRPAFADTYAGRHRLNLRAPYAAVAMRLLQRALGRLAPGVPLEPQSPVQAVRHAIVPTHDVDYLAVGRVSGMLRLAKNAVISCLIPKRPALGLKQAMMALRLALGGRDPMDQIAALAKGEGERAVTASYYFLLQHLHRRDANYTIRQPGLVNLMRSLEAQGMEIGVHGSYTSLDEPGRLAAEYDCLRGQGFRPQGGRQHWLRFTLDRLIPALERARVLYDTSIGWDRLGFRAGACFAFPPYNFEQERPATFLEIPMAIMDVSLRYEVKDVADWYSEAAEVLSVSRRYGWGGISLLWHPAAFGGGWLSPEAGHVFWRLLDDRNQQGDTWLSAKTFLQAVRQRYVDVGLLSAQDESAGAGARVISRKRLEQLVTA